MLYNNDDDDDDVRNYFNTIWFNKTPGSLLTLASIEGFIQKFPDWPPGARTANGTALCH
jgi:uncharacterized phage protein gp47/JayE